MEKELEQLQKSTNLFEVAVPDYRNIKICRREIVVLKDLWDIVVFVQVSSLKYCGCFNVAPLREREWLYSLLGLFH